MIVLFWCNTHIKFNGYLKLQLAKILRIFLGVICTSMCSPLAGKIAYFRFERTTMSNLILFEAEDTSSEKSNENSSVDGSYESSFIDDGDQSDESCHSSAKIKNGKPVSICTGFFF